jgi:hypothetical protein
MNSRRVERVIVTVLSMHCHNFLNLSGKGAAGTSTCKKQAAQT